VNEMIDLLLSDTRRGIGNGPCGSTSGQVFLSVQAGSNQGIILVHARAQLKWFGLKRREYVLIHVLDQYEPPLVPSDATASGPKKIPDPCL
jgi:hypothetical protein